MKMNSRQTEVQVFPPQYERPLSHLWMMDHRGGGRGETEAMTGRKEVIQIKLVKRYKAHFSYRILQKLKKKKICTEHQKMRTTVSSAVVYHVGIMRPVSCPTLKWLQNQREYKN